jgi:hypothetical protein
MLAVRLGDGLTEGDAVALGLGVGLTSSGAVKSIEDSTLFVL